MLKWVSLSSAAAQLARRPRFLSSFHSDNDIYVNLFHATARHLERPVPLSFTLSFHFDQHKCMCHEHRALDKQIDAMGGQETPSPVEERFQSHSGGPQAFLCHVCTVPGRKDSMVKVSTVYIHFYAHLLSLELTHCILLSHYLSSVTYIWSLGSESDTGCSAQVLQRHAGARSCPSSPFRQWQPRAWCRGALIRRPGPIGKDHWAN